MLLRRHFSLGVPSLECVHVGQNQVTGAVLAELLFVLSLDYGEGAEHVLHIVAVQAVEVEVEGVEPGPQVPPLLLVPDERRAVVAQPKSDDGQCWGSASTLFLDAGFRRRVHLSDRQLVNQLDQDGEESEQYTLHRMHQIFVFRVRLPGLARLRPGLNWMTTQPSD